MAGEGLNRYGWPYSHPINTQFDINWASPQARGLAAWLPPLASRGANVLRDLSGYHHNGTFAGVGEPAWVSDGKRGFTLAFDGNDDYINLGNPTGLQITGNLTIAAWIKVSVNQNGIIVGKDSDVGGRAFVLDYQAAGTRVRFYINGGLAGDIIVGNTALVLGRWYHIVGVYSTSGTLDLYVDGLSDAAQVGGVLGAIPGATADVLIGRRVFAGFNDFFGGRIADLRIYTRIFSNGEVYELYAAPWELYRPRILQRPALLLAAARIPRYGFTNYQIPGIA